MLYSRLSGCLLDKVGIYFCSVTACLSTLTTAKEDLVTVFETCLNYSFIVLVLIILAVSL